MRVTPDPFQRSSLVKGLACETKFVSELSCLYLRACMNEGSPTSSAAPVPPVVVGEEWEDRVVEKLLAQLKEPGSGSMQEVPGPPTHVDGELTHS